MLDSVHVPSPKFSAEIDHPGSINENDSRLLQMEVDQQDQYIGNKMDKNVSFCGLEHQIQYMDWIIWIESFFFIRFFLRYFWRVGCFCVCFCWCCFFVDQKFAKANPGEV